MATATARNVRNLGFPCVNEEAGLHTSSELCIASPNRLQSIERGVEVGLDTLQLCSCYKLMIERCLFALILLLSYAAVPAVVVLPLQL